MGKKKGPAWEFFKEKNKGVICKYCSKEYKQSNVNKMARQISKCFKCPQDMNKLLHVQCSSSMTKFVGVRKTVYAQPLGELQVDVTSDVPEEGPTSAGSHRHRPSRSLSCVSDLMSVSGTSSHQTETPVIIQPSPSSNVIGRG